MIEKLEEKGYITNKAVGTDWFMHKDTKEVHVNKKGNKLNEMFKYIPEGAEYMVVRDYHRDDNEYEFSVIVKDDDKYLFVTDVPRQTLNESNSE